MRTYLILILLPLSFALCNCSGESQTGGESSAEVTNDPTNKYIQLYDSLFPDEEFLVRKYVPVGEELEDYLPKKIPSYKAGKVYEYPASTLNNKNSIDVTCRNYERMDFRKDKGDYCTVMRSYDLNEDIPVDERDHARGIDLSITIHNNSVSVEKVWYNPEFFEPEKYKLLPTYKGYKYILNIKKGTGSTVSSITLFLPPFIMIYLEGTYVLNYNEELTEDEYFNKNWQKILDEIDLKKLNETYNIEGGKFKGRNL